MSVATLERSTEIEPETWLVFQTIDDRFSLELAQLPQDAIEALLWDSKQVDRDKLRFSAIGCSVPDAIRKLKENIAGSAFSTREEKAAMERVRVPE